MNRRALLMTTASPLPIWASVPIPPVLSVMGAAFGIDRAEAMATGRVS
jgi:hypothetical protein